MEFDAAETTRLPHVFDTMISLTAAAAETIQDESQKSIDGLETGGILLGHDDGTSVLVTSAGGPGPNAHRASDRFSRDLEHAVSLGNLAYADDGSVWVGEWHTHPTGPSTPSPADLSTYVRLVADPSLGFIRLAALIVLPCPDHGWEHTISTGWIVTTNQAMQVPVNIIDDRGGTA